MKSEDKIYVAGHTGLLGSSLVRKLKENGYRNIVFKKSNELDLTKISQVESFFERENPDYVFLSAAKCGGILSNIEEPVKFILDNLQIQNNIIQTSHKYKVKKLLFVGSSASYPKVCNQPIKEEYLLSSYLDSSNEFYSTAKIAGIKLCQAYYRQYSDNFISVMPANIYGPNDKFDLKNSHVVASLIKKFVNAKKSKSSVVECWGTGNARREMIYVDDLSDALIFIMNNYHEEGPINVGTGIDYSIKELVDTISKIVQYDGSIFWDHTKPEGTLQRLLDSSKLFNLGWSPKYNLNSGLQATYEYYKLEVK